MKKHLFVCNKVLNCFNIILTTLNAVKFLDMNGNVSYL